VLAPLLETRPASLTIANRTPQRATELAAEFAARGPVMGCGFAELPHEPFDVIVNATSAGLHGDALPLSPGHLSRATLCYDMSYGKGDTSFTRWARDNGATRAYKGFGMLVEQAAESFSLWRGVRPETRPVLEALLAV
jgi:shikimate dehydrogenase